MKSPHGKILLTGVTGKVGRLLAGLLAKEDIPVRVLLRRREQAAEFKSLGFEVCIGDLNRPASLPAAVDGVESLYLVYPDRPDRAVAERNLIDAAKNAGVRRIVKQSAFAASLDPPVSFGILLAQTDAYLMNSGLDWTILRPYAFMQNILDVAETVAVRGILPMPFGKARVGFVDCSDIALAAYHTLLDAGHSRQIYYLSGPECLTLEQVAKVMERVLEREIRYLPLPFFIARFAMRKQMSDYQIALLKPLLKMLKAGGEEILFTDVEKICRTKPRNIECFIRDHIADFSLA